jgi:small subunit ribosomal protein S16
LHKGAHPTDTVRRILSFKGVLYLKHLLRGVKLGLFDEATAMVKFQKWHEEHEAKNTSKQQSYKKDVKARRQPPVIKKVEEVKQDVAPAAEAPETPAAEAPAATAE